MIHKVLNYETDREEIDAHYIMSGYDFVRNLMQNQKFEILEEIQKQIATDIQLGVDLRVVCQKYIWH